MVKKEKGNKTIRGIAIQPPNHEVHEDRYRSFHCV
jgi:hypothetical protein